MATLKSNAEQQGEDPNAACKKVVMELSVQSSHFRSKPDANMLELLETQHPCHQEDPASPRSIHGFSVSSTISSLCG